MYRRAFHIFPIYNESSLLKFNHISSFCSISITFPSASCWGGDYHLQYSLYIKTNETVYLEYKIDKLIITCTKHSKIYREQRLTILGGLYYFNNRAFSETQIGRIYLKLTSYKFWNWKFKVCEIETDNSKTYTIIQAFLINIYCLITGKRMGRGASFVTPNPSFDPYQYSMNFVMVICARSGNIILYLYHCLIEYIYFPILVQHVLHQFPTWIVDKCDLLDLIHFVHRGT